MGQVVRLKIGTGQNFEQQILVGQDFKQKVWVGQVFFLSFSEGRLKKWLCLFGVPKYQWERNVPLFFIKIVVPQ